MPQTKIIKALMNPKAYPHKVRDIKLFQTYISYLFFTGRYVYKIKKPVNFEYLDFTTLKKRKFFCEEELRLNKRLCEDMYLEVVPITKKGNSIKIKGKGRVVEYALKMKQIPHKYLMKRLIKQGKITKPILDRIAKIIARFHSQAEISKAIDKYGSLNIIKKNWQENFRQTKDFIRKTINQSIYNFIQRNVNKFIKENKNLFKKRIKQKKIRDCQGDINADDVFITPKKIYIIDCIEFNKRFRYQDVASDVAFLAMDLDFLDREDLSDHLIKRYIKYSQDKDTEKLLAFYKCYRAYIKGKIFGFQLLDPHIPKAKREEAREKAERYFSLAFRYAYKLSKGKPCLLIMCGIMGCGKSTRAEDLAKKTGISLLRTDLIRKEMLGIKPTEHRYEKYYEGVYKEKNIYRIYKEMIKRAKKLLKNNQPCILDATFSRKKYRDLAFSLAKELKTPYFLIEYKCPDEVILKRMKKRMREKTISDARPALFYKTKKDFEPLKISKKHHLVIDTTKDKAWCTDKVLSRILK